MMSRALNTLVFLAILLPTTVEAQHNGTEGRDLAELEAQVDELMADYNRSDAPGAVIGVVHGGELVFAKAYGMASLEQGTRLTTGSILDVGSVSKQMTAFAVALLAQRGALDLDADIRTHLPEVPDFGHRITVRHMVHHVSGLREIYNASALAGYQSGDGLAQEDALRLTTRMNELNFAPGTEYLYSNTGYMLLADIVSRVSGMPFPEFMEENVFRPLGMTQTTIMARRGQVIPGAAESYQPLEDGGFRRVFDNSGIQGAGGVYTTVDDLARWVTNYRTAEVGGSEVIEQMKQHGVLTSGDTLAYAFGINVGEYRGLESIAHTGSSAGYRASVTYFPEIDAGVIRQSNRADFDASIPGRVAEIFFGHAMDPVATTDDEDESGGGTDGSARTSREPAPADLQALTGRYYSPELETVYTLSVEEGSLVARHRRHPEFVLTPVESDVYEGEGFFGTARFERDESGAVTGMRVSNGRVRNLLFVRMEG
ncbi:MAG: serine hydrolase domain-containing protein [Longimicrobiales bacterium]|nr:serine hydrolase domain-containing protein [Longimicrobiales bacterium]